MVEHFTLHLPPPLPLILIPNLTRSRLTRAGVLWLVAQEQVPIGRMLAAYGDFAWVETVVSEDGRFVT